MNCPSLEDLVALFDPAGGAGLDPVEGSASGAAAAASARRQHVDGGCPRCDQRLAFLSTLVGDLRSLPLEPASAATVGAARALGAPVPLGQGATSGEGSIKSGWRDLIAVLMPRSEAVPAVRSSAASNPPQLYRTAGYEIDLTLLESGALLGQVLPEDPDAPGLGDGDVYLYGPDCAQATDLLVTGEFRFASVAPDRFSLVIAANATRIVVQDVDLQPR
ncbi:hypothetical protein [Engelhardtia mirabilis]|uniref:Uncharacterized protein n=1 Tax=Engelhardtia mirabilis TaxID=2528011 RepID=A0A518BNV7_9BACT|nr:hypothetical protein Pla133_37600 [Planctomycetes bacterium Pla133]QDV02985.1 hypothetical protein Pla86_37590 [Planctomycetes bacterium Pla86]